MNKISGFTLIELMIVMAVIGLISAISLPFLKTYTARTERVDECKQPLHEMARAQLDFEDINGTYTIDPADLNYPGTSSRGKYTYKIEPGTTNNIRSSFLITCEKVSGVNNDEDCGNLTLDNFGRQGVVGGTKGAIACWR